MSRHFPKSTHEDRINWLTANTAEWINKNPANAAHMTALALVLKHAGLYSMNTNTNDVAIRLEPLLVEAKKKLQEF